MRVLLDHNVDRRLRRHLPGHAVRTVREMAWDQLKNGDLLRAAAKDGFEVLVTLDKNIEHQQNLKALPLPVVVLDTPSAALPALLPLVNTLMALLSGPLKLELCVAGPGAGDVRHVSGSP